MLWKSSYWQSVIITNSNHPELLSQYQTTSPEQNTILTSYPQSLPQTIVFQRLPEPKTFAETCLEMDTTMVLSPNSYSLQKNLQETFAQAEKLANEGKSPRAPPRQLLQYLVRMGSFTSVPAIREDVQDIDFQVSPSTSRESLLDRCRAELPQFPFLITRNFTHLPSMQIGNEAPTSAFEKEAFATAASVPLTALKRIPFSSQVCSSTANDSPPVSSSRFRVLTWNILAQALAVQQDNFVGLPEGTLDWGTRRLRVLHEILLYDPDVICLQEVDHFNFLNSTLSSLGYRGVFCSKPDSPCIYLANNNGPDGCALFFRRDKFDLISVSSRVLEIWKVQSNQVCIFANLRLRSTGQHICIATTHLKAKQGALLTTMRNEQGKDLANYLVQSGGCNRPLVLCGDFNAVPSEPVIDTLKTRLELSSAYSELFDGEDPPYTTWKVRGDGEYCHTLDYIFHNKLCEVTSVLRLPSEDQVGPSRLPNLSYPSDHIAIACDIRIKS